MNETVSDERGWLLSFIRERIPSDTDPEDILQDVLYDLIENTRLMRPVKQLTS